MPAMHKQSLRIGIIGGSGLAEALGAPTGHHEFPDTPFGKPSSPITLTRWDGMEIALLSRHGAVTSIRPVLCHIAPTPMPSRCWA